MNAVRQTACFTVLSMTVCKLHLRAVFKIKSAVIKVVTMFCRFIASTKTGPVSLYGG